MTTKKVILLSTSTYFALNTIIWLLGWLVWPIGILAVWLLCGHFARKMTRYANGPDDKGWNYIVCNLCGPLVIMIIFIAEFDIFTEKLKFPQFRNPFVWPEK